LPSRCLLPEWDGHRHVAGAGPQPFRRRWPDPAVLSDSCTPRSTGAGATPPGIWKGRGLAAVGLTAEDVVTERQAELLLGEGRHPEADQIERVLLAAGESPARARRATVLGRPIEHNQSPETENAKERTPWLAMDLTFRAPSTAQIAWALLDEEHRLMLELCQDIARDKTLAWLEDSVAQIRRGSGGKHREPIRDGLIVAVFRHYTSKAGTSTLIPRCAGPISTPPGRGKRGAAEGATGRRHRRAGRPRVWALARRPDHQTAPGRRTGPEAHVHRDHGRAAGRFSAVRVCPEQGPCPASWAGQAAHPARSRACRQGVRLTEEPCLPAAAGDPLHHPGQGRPGPQPQEPRLARRPAAEVRPAGLQGSARGRVRHQPPQKAPSRGHVVRQARGPLRGDCPRRGHQRVAAGSIFAMGPVALHFSASNAWATARLSS
jgi:hypothetical protein